MADGCFIIRYSWHGVGAGRVYADYCVPSIAGGWRCECCLLCCNKCHVQWVVLGGRMGGECVCARNPDIAFNCW